MSAAPFMQVYVADYTADVQHLTCEQDGAYWRLLRAMWRAGGELPDDARKLALICGLSPARWRKISPEVMALFTATDGVITQKRLANEIEKASEKSEKRSQAGRLGGRAKALKTNKLDLANASGLPKHSLEPDIRTPSEAKASSVCASGRSPPPAKPKSKRMPASWSPGAEELIFAAAERLTAGETERELAKMRDYQFRDAHSDWGAVFRNWIRRAAESKPRGAHARPDQPASQPSPRVRHVADVFEALGAASGSGGG